MTNLEWIHQVICETYFRETLDRITAEIAVDVQQNQFPEPYAANLLRSAIRRQRAIIDARSQQPTDNDTTSDVTTPPVA